MGENVNPTRKARHSSRCSSLMRPNLARGTKKNALITERWLNNQFSRWGSAVQPQQEIDVEVCVN